MEDQRPSSQQSNASGEEELWSSMLSNVASSKRLPQKSIMVLGGGPDDQREFVESLGAGSHRKTDKKPPIANEFALGYTYLDVLDADHEDVLARLSLYLVSAPTPSFAPLVKPLFTPQTLHDTLVVILLDWRTPWDWLRQMRTWVRLLQKVFTDLDNSTRKALDEVMQACAFKKIPPMNFASIMGLWLIFKIEKGESRPRNFAETGATQAPGTADVQIPLGPGEFDEPIGLPLCVVCQNADKIDILERERGWKEEEFDFVLQFLRTILLKHGASLIYTSPSAPSSLRPLIYSLLSLPESTRQTLRHNVIERDKVLVPPSWDSWGKIRVLRDFDVETVGAGWSVDIQPLQQDGDEFSRDDIVEGGAVEVYEDVIKDSRKDNSVNVFRPKGSLEVPPVDPQEFLASQFELLEAKKEEEKNAMATQGGKNAMGTVGVLDGDSRVRDHVGPVQFNVGGIQVDADDMLRRLKDRDSGIMLDKDSVGPAGTPGSGSQQPSSPSATGPDGKSQNEVLAQFFSSLMNKKGSKGSGSGGSGSSRPGG